MRSNKIIKTFLVCLFAFTVSTVYSQQGWQWQYPQPQGDNLSGAYFINSTTGLAVGNGGTILRTTNSGTAWTVVYKNLSLTLNSISFRDAQNGIAVGNSGKLLVTSNAGATWIAAPDITFANINKVQFTNSLTGYAAADSGYFFKSTNGGLNWLQSSLVEDHLHGLYFYNNTTGWVSNSEGLVFCTTDGGVSYVIANTGFDNDVTGIYFINAQTGWATGVSSTSNQRGFIFKSTDGGETWPVSQVFSPFEGQSINDISFINAQTGYAVGDDGLFYSTTNAGTNWTINSGLSVFDLKYVKFTAPTDVFAFGSGGQIFKSSNVGANWSRYLNAGLGDVKKMRFTSSTNGLMAGNSENIYKTTDGGATWGTVITGNPTSIYDIIMIDQNTGYITVGGGARKTTNGGLNWIAQGLVGSGIPFTSGSYINANTGWIVSSTGLLYKTTNGGVYNSTTITPQQNFVYVSFQDASTGIAVSKSPKNVLRSTNGGTNWSVISTFTAADSINSVHFGNSSTGWIAGNGVVYKTTNGGANWVSSTVLPNTNINGVNFANANTGWCSGANGLAARSTNGGSTWEIQSTSSVVNLNEPYFLNTTTGWITGANGVLLKTTTGGNVFVSQTSTEVPEKYSLHQNYPNPFNPMTKIKFDMKKVTDVNIKVYDTQGREVAELVNERLGIGSYEVTFNGANLSSGIYFYKLTTGDFVESKKMMLIK